MSKLFKIKSFIDPCINVISTIIQAQITVVDTELNRVSGTGSYVSLPRDCSTKSSVFFEKILSSGEVSLVTNVREDAVCNGCRNRDICFMKAEMGFPIEYKGGIIGVIGISAFTEEEGQYIIENYDRLCEFVKYISLLITNHLQSTEHSEQLQEQLDGLTRSTAGYHMLGNSPKMKELFALGSKIAASDSTVLITGESGTGKEEMAKFLHAKSKRCHGPMIAINCGAIPENLVESELFGYESGAFTGAKRGGAAGKFELANKGTLFLDEIGELPLTAQTKLLRVLQERQVERVGGTKSIPLDIRIVAATNQSMEQMVEKHIFRQDLYYRLNVIPMKMPPLRERGEDILLLAHHFLRHYNRVLHKNIQGFDYEAENALLLYSWPGNIRELKNVVEFLANITDNPLIGLHELPSYLQQKRDYPAQDNHSLNEMMQNYEKMILKNCLESHHQNKAYAAKELGISLATLYRKLSQYHLL